MFKKFSEKLGMDEQANESVNESVNAAKSAMFGFMKKASTAASVMVKEGSVQAVQLKNRAVVAADMDNLQKKLSNALDLKALEFNGDLNTLNLDYITPNLIAMGFPSDREQLHVGFNSIQQVAGLLNKKHFGKFMIWNLSEEPYDYGYFEDQVLEFKFPGHPAPPLGVLFRICTSIESWLEADGENVAAIHCLTGKGRTSTVIASYLAWMGHFKNTNDALAFVCQKRKIEIHKMTIPSQIRYLQYFSNMLDGVKPRSSPLLLRRVIMNSIPGFEKRSQMEKEQAAVDEGCRPYMQIFKGGKLVFTTTWQQNEENKNAVDWISTTEGSISFNMECLLQGDVLVRCRHVHGNGKRVSMFRAAFHTGYIPMGILRLTKAQLDGACNDERFQDDFFIDLIFAPVQVHDEVTEVPQEGRISISKDDRPDYDDMLNRDESFWVDIADRKRRHSLQRKSTNSATANSPGSFSLYTPEEEAKNALLAKEDDRVVQSSMNVHDEIKEEEAQLDRLQDDIDDVEASKAILAEPVSINDESNCQEAPESLCKADDTSLLKDHVISPNDDTWKDEGSTIKVDHMEEKIAPAVEDDSQNAFIPNDLNLDRLETNDDVPSNAVARKDRNSLDFLDDDDLDFDNLSPTSATGSDGFEIDDLEAYLKTLSENN